jgi:hypothetical protein
MKLYTEEQVIEMTQAACIAGQNNNPFTFWEVCKNITPIEIPSDEEIEKEINANVFIENDNDFLEGAKWMRDKIQGGNK